MNKDGMKIDKNVYVATVKIWNSGDDEIKSDDVRTPFRIEMSGLNDIIDFTEIFETRGNTDKFVLDNSHVLSWAHFDPKEGVTIHIEYLSDKSSGITVSGYAVKSSDIRLADNLTLGPFDRRLLWPLGKSMLVFISLQAGGELSSVLTKKRLKASLFEIFFGIVGFCIEIAAFLYIVSLIEVGNHIEYAPF